MRLITTSVGLPTATKVQRGAMMHEARRRRDRHRLRDRHAYRLMPGGHVLLDRQCPVGRMLKPAARAQSDGG